MMKRLLVATGLVIALVLAASPAGAQQYPPSAFFVSVSDTTVVPGQTVTVSGSVTPGASGVEVSFFSVEVSLGSATPAVDGAFSLSATIPSDATVGEHTITAVDSTGLELSTGVTVVGAGQATAAAAGAAGAGGTGGGGLARTGGESLPLVGIAAVLLAGGGLLVLGSRRRRHASSSRGAGTA
jgi:LPXTG-motif cell wall-anchored protein